MKLMLMKLIIMNSMTLIKLKNPMSISTLIIFKTLLICMLMNFLSLTSWFSMMFFLMMVGGLLIIFSYMTSTVSNEKFKFKINLTIMLIMILPLENNTIENIMNENGTINYNYEITKLSMMKLFNKKSLNMSIFIIIYLLMTMIMVSKLIMKNLGPLRSKN
uniref:NADH dehydrogenase subunit 6 n=1 Tax=Batracomorphus fuscomaculatus TaxID=3045904 RepID=UPI00257D410A|nr:NADH dehydrogenase subunit 6 [Batracomorphus fuscomaculatus]WHE42635.1 NADH dehydrogenase subunit 6 [Batracomorphus fuscomaculatus]